MVYKRPRVRRVRVSRRPSQRLARRVNASLTAKKYRVVSMAKLLTRRSGIPLRTALRISAKLLGYKKRRFHRR